MKIVKNVILLLFDININEEIILWIQWEGLDWWGMVRCNFNEKHRLPLKWKILPALDSDISAWLMRPNSILIIIQSRFSFQSHWFCFRYCVFPCLHEVPSHQSSTRFQKTRPIFGIVFSNWHLCEQYWNLNANQAQYKFK